MCPQVMRSACAILEETRAGRQGQLLISRRREGVCGRLNMAASASHVALDRSLPGILGESRGRARKRMSVRLLDACVSSVYCPSEDFSAKIGRMPI